MNVATRPSHSNMPMQSSQGHMFPPGQIQGQNRQSRPMIPSQSQFNSVQRMPSQFDAVRGQSQLLGQNLSQGQMQFPQNQGQGMRSPFQHSPSNKENLPKPEFPLMSGGDPSHVNPGQGHQIRPTMFSQPPPAAVPFPNFSNPPPDLSPSANLQQNSQTPQISGSGSFHISQVTTNQTTGNFSHAPGTERTHVGRPQGQEQGQMRQPVSQNQQGVSLFEFPQV